MVKKIIAVFVLLCSLLCVGVNAFAWTDEDYQTLKNLYYDKQTDTYSNYVIWLDGEELYVIGDISDYKVWDSGKVWFYDSRDRCITTAYRIKISGADATSITSGRPGPTPIYTTFLYSNMTFIDEDGTTVFPPPPTPTPEPTEVIQTVQMGVTSIIQMITKVVLIAFGSLSVILLAILCRRVPRFLKTLVQRL